MTVDSGRGPRQRVGRRVKQGARSLRDAFSEALLRARAKRRNPRLITCVARTDNMRLNGGLQLYFEVGESALEQIQRGLHAGGVGEPRAVLDAPSGYGRVLRYMRAAWPEADLVAMDLLAPAVDYCAATFGARPVRSADPIWAVDGVGDSFDLVWSGSLLTHFDADAWGPTLAYFRDRLRPGGALIFTTHGERSIRLVSEDAETHAIVQRACPGWSGDYGLRDPSAVVHRARSSGFAFEAYPWHEPGTWGLSVSTADWVRDTADAVGGLRYVSHVEHGWFEHQDVWTYIRD